MDCRNKSRRGPSQRASRKPSVAALRLPDGASIHRNERAAAQIEKILASTPGVEHVTTFGGLDFVTSTNNSNVATIFGLPR
jgi:multidrug efflux pump subunit AcrB